jgi:hypothetical protein
MVNKKWPGVEVPSENRLKAPTKQRSRGRRGCLLVTFFGETKAAGPGLFHYMRLPAKSPRGNGRGRPKVNLFRGPRLALQDEQLVRVAIDLAREWNEDASG